MSELRDVVFLCSDCFTSSTRANSGTHAHARAPPQTATHQASDMTTVQQASLPLGHRSSSSSRVARHQDRALRHRHSCVANSSRGASSVSASALPPLLPWAEKQFEAQAKVEIIDLVPAEDSVDVAEASRLAEATAGLGPFKTALGAFVYFNGYRQLFRLLGYPGITDEFAMASRLGKRTCPF